MKNEITSMYVKNIKIETDDTHHVRAFSYADVAFLGNFSMGSDMSKLIFEFCLKSMYDMDIKEFENAFPEKML